MESHALDPTFTSNARLPALSNQRGQPTDGKLPWSKEPLGEIWDTHIAARRGVTSAAVVYQRKLCQPPRRKAPRDTLNLVLAFLCRHPSAPADLCAFHVGDELPAVERALARLRELDFLTAARRPVWLRDTTVAPEDPATHNDTPSQWFGVLKDAVIAKRAGEPVSTVVGRRMQQRVQCAPTNALNRLARLIYRKPGQTLDAYCKALHCAPDELTHDANRLREMGFVRIDRDTLHPVYLPRARLSAKSTTPSNDPEPTLHH